MADGGPRTILTIDDLMSAGPAQGGIEVLSWTWSQQMGGTMSFGAGAAAGRVQMSDLSLQTAWTPRLPAVPSRHRQAPLPGRTRCEDVAETLRMVMEEVLITSSRSAAPWTARACKSCCPSPSARYGLAWIGLRGDALRWLGPG